MPANSARSDVKEDRLARSLEADVEAVAAALGHCDQRLAAGGRHQREDRVLGVGLLLVSEVDPGHDAVEHASRHQGHGDVRSLEPAPGLPDTAGLDGDDLELAVPRLDAVAGEAAKT